MSPSVAGSFGSYINGSTAGLPFGASASTAPVEIVLDNDHLVLRGQGGDMNPAYLSGHVSIWLVEPMNIKDITLNLSGKAKVHYSDGSKWVCLSTTSDDAH